MNLSPSETEKLLLAVAGMVARDRLRPRRQAELPRVGRAAQHLGDRAGPGGRPASRS